MTCYCQCFIVSLDGVVVDVFFLYLYKRLYISGATLYILFTVLPANAICIIASVLNLIFKFLSLCLWNVNQIEWFFYRLHFKRREILTVRQYRITTGFAKKMSLSGFIWMEIIVYLHDKWMQNVCWCSFYWLFSNPISLIDGFMDCRAKRICVNKPLWATCY